MRTCDECRAPLIQRAKEKPGRFATRRLCSRRCAALIGSRAAREKAHAKPPPNTTIERNGYLLRWVRDREAAPSQKREFGTYVYVHRLVMEEHLGRRLGRREIVHHKNHDRHDNRIENLEIFNGQSAHLRYHWNKGPKPRCAWCGDECGSHGNTYCSKSCLAFARHAVEGPLFGATVYTERSGH